MYFALTTIFILEYNYNNDSNCDFWPLTMCWSLCFLIHTKYEFLAPLYEDSSIDILCCRWANWSSEKLICRRSEANTLKETKSIEKEKEIQQAKDFFTDSIQLYLKLLVSLTFPFIGKIHFPFGLRASGRVPMNQNNLKVENNYPKV